MECHLKRIAVLMLSCVGLISLTISCCEKHWISYTSRNLTSNIKTTIFLGIWKKCIYMENSDMNENMLFQEECKGFDEGNFLEMDDTPGIHC